MDRRACRFRTLLVVQLMLCAAADASAEFYKSSTNPTSTGAHADAQYRLLPSDEFYFGNTCFSVEGERGENERFTINGWPRPMGHCVTSSTLVHPRIAYTADYPPGCYKITFVATDARTGAVLSRREINMWAVLGYCPVDPPPPPPEAGSLRIRAGLGEETPGPAGGATLPSEARVPLGGVVTFEATTEDGDVLPSTFSLGEASVEEGVASLGLFPTSVLLPHETGALNRRTYLAVHLGQVTVTATPDDPEIAPGTLTIHVDAPAALGSAFNEVDAVLVEVAHRWGVPPQFVKAHAHKESSPSFDRMSYRYEPIGAWVGDLTAISRGPNLRTVSPYSDYRVATERDTANPALAAGTKLSPEDRDARGGLRIACDKEGKNGRDILPSDELVTAWEIFRCNDSRMNWKREARAAGQSRADSLKSDLFTAQTSLAASYGLLQMTYVTAIDELRWAGTDDGRRNPSLLFDTDENLLAGGGSVNLGTLKVVRAFRQLDSDLATGVRVPTGQAEIVGVFVKAWNRYNPWQKGYGESVASRVSTFAPVTAAPVLGGQQ